MAGADPGDAPLVVPERLAELVEAIGDAGAVRASGRQFLDLLPERCATFTAALDGGGDREAVFRVAHTLKSSGHMLGMPAIAGAAALVEETPGDAERIRALLDVIARSEGALEAALDALPDPS
jgi:HPt (histidine-containing phosphotransfer) domain-containing protein